MRYYFLGHFPNINDKRKRTIKIKNKIFAKDAAPAAIPPKPKNAATIAIIKNVTAQRNITVNLKLKKLFNKLYRKYCAIIN